MYEVLIMVVPWDKTMDTMVDVQEGEGIADVDTLDVSLLDVVNRFQSQLPRSSRFEAVRFVKVDGVEKEPEVLSFSTGATEDESVKSTIDELLSSIKKIGEQISKING